MRCFVAGATGFLGGYVARALRDAGHDAVLASRHGGNVDGMPVAALDLADEAAVETAARGSDAAYLVHGMVSRDKNDAEALHAVHVVATERALVALRRAGVRRVVHASTSGTLAVGTDPDAVHDESAPAPMPIIASWPYYRSKYYGEQAALAASDPPYFEVVVVNPSLLLGPGDEHESSTGDVRRFLERAVPAIPAGGLAFVDVRDVALGMLAACERGRPGERYLLSAKNMTLAAFFQRLERLSGVKAPRLRLPRSHALAIGSTRLFGLAVRAIGLKSVIDEVSVEMAQHYWYCDPGKAERELGFRARDPGETLRDTVGDIVSRKRAFPRGALLGEVRG